ncbi:MAG: acetyltransferase [bacterium]
MDKIVLVGGGGHAKVIISIIKKIKKYEIYGYVDKIHNGNILGVPYIGDDDVLKELIAQQKVTKAVLCVGQISDQFKRYRLYKQLVEMGFAFPTIVSPNASINEAVEIGEGTVVMDGVVINSGAKIGRFAILNTQASIDHDCEIGDFVHIAPGVVLSGGVKVGNYCLIGAGATVIQYKRIGNNCVIGAGAVVLKDCLEPGTYLGIPARKR